jgi:outer membrane protein TolC
MTTARSWPLVILLALAGAGAVRADDAPGVATPYVDAEADADVDAEADAEVAPLPAPLRLEDAMALARAGRAEILAARARADAASARPRAVAALEDPTIALSLDHVPFALHGVDASLTVEQRFPLSRVRRHRRLAAEADARRLAADVDRVGLDVEAEAARAFVMLREERAMLAILGEQRQLADQLVQAATARYGAGKGMQADVLRAELDVARLAGELAAKTAEIRAAEIMLNTSLGRPAGARVPALADAGEGEMEPPSIEDVARAALARRPELRAGRAEVERSQAEIATMKDMYRPMAMVQTGPAYTMTDGAGWMLMVGVSVPLWRDRLRAGVDEARAMRRMAEQDLRAMQRMVTGDAAVARERVLAARSRWLALRDQVVPRARAAVEPTLAAYVSGDAPLVSVLEMIDEVTMARMELAAAERQLGLAWVLFTRATAGRATAG